MQLPRNEKWLIETASTTAAQMHGRELEARRTIWNVLVDGPAVVLGSNQHSPSQRSSNQHSSSKNIGAAEVLDIQACQDAGVAVVKRRSGGGLVYLAPEQQIWIDVVIAREDFLWTDDVGKSAQWLGDAWCRALTALGHRDLRVQRTATPQTPLGKLICFAGSGTGEVFCGEQKFVGISQRRTSMSARFQCVVYRTWQPQTLLDLLSGAASDVVTMNGGVTALSDLVANTDHGAEVVCAALAAQLQTL